MSQRALDLWHVGLEIHNGFKDAVDFLFNSFHWQDLANDCGGWHWKRTSPGGIVKCSAKASLLQFGAQPAS
jgi:hypothetical protein